MGKDFVALLGVRGSIPVSGAQFQRHGGATTCVVVHLSDKTIVLDAGTGLLQFTPTEKNMTLLLTHPHIDHLLGLSMWHGSLDASMQIDIYGAERGGKTLQEQVEQLFSPPLWPVSPVNLPARFCFHSLPPEMMCGGVQIHSMEGIHPGGVTLFRLDGNGKSVVLMTDCTLTEELLPRAAAFAKDCDLLLCDGQYSESEWVERAGFGHSTWQMAAAFAKQCGAKQARIIHHDPARTDEELQNATALLGNGCAFAAEGEEILL